MNAGGNRGNNGVFRVTGLTNHRIRNLAIHHEGRRLAGTLAVRDAEPGPLVARLRPWGTVSGRLVDRDGRPRAGVTLSYQDSYSGRRPFPQAFPKDVTTDSSGRFTFVGLVPEQEYVIKLVASGRVCTVPSPWAGRTPSNPAKPKTSAT